MALRIAAPLVRVARKLKARMVRHTLAWLLPTLFVLPFYLTGYAAPAFRPATAPDQARVVRNANLRAGPGTNFAVVGYAEPGKLLSILGCNSDCTWYQVAPDCWIAAFLVAPVQVVTAASALEGPGGVPISSTVPVTGVITGANIVFNPTRCPQTARPISTYAGPGAFYAVVDTRPQGECVAVVGRDQEGAWYQLSHGMWILAADVLYAEPLRTIPITDLTPTPTSTPIPTITPGPTDTPVP